MVSEKALRRYDLEREEQLSELRRLRAERRTQKLLGWAWHYGVQNQTGMKRALSTGSSTVTLDLTPMELKDLLYSRDPAIVGIELHEEGEDDITQAMVDTSIISSALPYGSTRGNGIGIYMTESGCANESWITNYDRLSGSQTNHSRNVGAII